MKSLIFPIVGRRKVPRCFTITALIYLAIAASAQAQDLTDGDSLVDLSLEELLSTENGC